MKFYNFLGVLGGLGLVSTLLMFGYQMEGIESNSFMDTVYDCSVLFLIIWVFAGIFADVVESGVSEAIKKKEDSIMGLVSYLTRIDSDLRNVRKEVDLSRKHMEELVSFMDKHFSKKAKPEKKKTAHKVNRAVKATKKATKKVTSKK